MKRMIVLILFLMTYLTVNAETKTVSETDKTYSDIKQTLGILPTFMKDYPTEAITGAWMNFKGIQLNAASAIPGKYKELIGLAVAAQIPCDHCVYFHREFAKLNKATNQEFKETLAVAGSARRWSTVINGAQTDIDKFKSEVDRQIKFLNSRRDRQAMEEKFVVPAPIMTAEDAYKDIEASFGFVPTYMKAYPAAGIVGAWRELKGLEMNSNTALPGKYKDLIGLAVGAQIPCAYCVYYNTQLAISNGASQNEINEAIALAGITRQWSTVLNGQDLNEKKFKGEVNQIIKVLNFRMKESVTLSN